MEAKWTTSTTLQLLDDGVRGPACSPLTAARNFLPIQMSLGYFNKDVTLFPPPSSPREKRGAGLGTGLAACVCCFFLAEIALLSTYLRFFITRLCL